MVSEIAPSLAYHYWLLGIKGRELTGEADPLVLVKGTEFEPEPEITFEDDEGHTGTATTIMSSYRSSAQSSPSYTDKTRYKEGWEDIWFLLLGSADPITKEIRKEAKTDAPNVYDYTFAVNSTAPEDPYFATIYNGFAKTEDDAFIYEDALLNEFELNFSNEEAMTYTATFASNYPAFNQQNPARTIPKTTVFSKPSDVSVYIAPFKDGGYESVDAIETAGAKYGCYIEGSLTVNNNVENQPCASDDFGTSTKVIGNREAEFTLTLPWTNQTKKLQYQFMGGSDTATRVSFENDIKTVWIVCKSGKIKATGGTTDTNYNYQTIIKIPQVNITVANSAQSGSDAKELELEGTIMENGTDSFIETVITTDLAALHIDEGDTEGDSDP